MLSSKPNPIRQTGWLILFFGVACVPGIGRTAAMAALIVAACVSPAWTMKSLVASVAIVMFNPAISEAGSILFALKWVLLLVATIRTFTARVGPSNTFVRLVTYWLLITGFLLVNSFAISVLASVSFFKTLSFSAGMLCFLRLTMLTRHRNTEMLLFVAQVGAAVAILSLPLLGAGVGYSVNGTGFNGVLNHPQAMGVFFVITGAATAAAALRMTEMRRTLLVMGLAQWALIYVTKSRTALIALVVGAIVFGLELLARNMKAKSLGEVNVRFAVLAVCLMGVAAGALVSPEIRGSVFSYIQKRESEQTIFMQSPLVSLRNSSREQQVENTLEEAKAHPLFGVGFGVDEDSVWRNANSDSLFGIPLTSPLEQGFFPLATIAQIGLVGSSIIVLLIVYMYRLSRRESPEHAALFVTVFGVNMGEMIFYSFGGLGSLMWAVLTLLAVGCSTQSWHHQQNSLANDLDILVKRS